ncbi:hypothetical protein [Bacteroides pyogenes]|uniref:hypothetical protein n=1 Tax=Bacteroides pyogenes TaxID=310300 RepID=UPI00242EC276|nr:hypothetical protein [Bacteroides pyogenes]MCI7069379.1 hypothetical protein [Bacteroides pyogenes]MDY4248445.1 hypothetical protein [Bacteroides pyogenes]
MKYIWTMCVLLLVCSCNTVKEDTIINEDYEKIFPPKEIEKPENKRGELTVQLCDPDLALENYKYPGTEMPEGAEQYKVTLVCRFNEIDRKGDLVDDQLVTARYEVKYINEKKKLVTITCGKKNQESAEEDDTEEGNDEDGDEGKNIDVMRNGQDLEITFTVYSGFPLYLSVRGMGPRNSNVKASIKAVSTDGLIEIPELNTNQYQNEEGPNMLRNPYCEYIVLP